MSDDQAEPQIIPEPKHFVVSPVEDGAFSKHLPTITAVYLGLETQVDPSTLSNIDGGSVDKDDTVPGGLQLSLFVQPKDAEAFMDVATYPMTAPKHAADMFLDNLKKIKCFVFAISTDDFYYQCKIDTKSASTTESTCTYRLLN